MVDAGDRADPAGRRDGPDRGRPALETAQGKRQLRERMRARLGGLDAETVAAAGLAIVDHWRGEPELSAARRVLLYAALPRELPTRPLFEHLRGQGCEVLLPRGGAEGLEFARVDAWSELVAGRHGVLEPPPLRAAAPLQGMDPVLLPGLAFDRSGNRLGRGEAWYDRTFRTAAPARLIGVGFALQVVDSVPRDDWDRRVGAILTERGLSRLPGSGRGQP